MAENKIKPIINTILSSAGITINGSNPWDIKVYDDRLYQRILIDHSLGLGEAYMDGWWDCQQLDIFFHRILSHNVSPNIKINRTVLLEIIKFKLFNKQNKTRAKQVAARHYDLGNDLFKHMLGKHMAYSCGYWKSAKNIDQAQEAKFDLICKKLQLKPGMSILDVGCGWGSLSKFAAEKYKVKVTGVTISKKQSEFGRSLCQGSAVNIKIQDYRDIQEKYDRIVSVGMFEHVGFKNYNTYMKVIERCLKDDGLFLLHTIGANNLGSGIDIWIDKYIFPNGMIPSSIHVIKNIENRFIIEDWHNFGADYDKTLMAWQSNFENNWDKIRNNYDNTFYRMWKFYLSSCAAMFRARNLQLWQIVLSKKGVPGGYISIR
ncbi:MAG: cyclopropane fatty acyl phospholipid synthase [Candidatus Margulisiibacteriota bacterium]|nr:MAG: cyclopropane-fatty-acyl-phospholipid synthase [Candidatus Margulisbacteria bacterium GWD2_39_127]OGI02886.1 MAG: cyclopropane-fatty-acyl-phospholipid synthase [Candidatus Margulisbacteria bacterium GWF2_38_17]OGI06818.1 MAG: cyclopropane-fatty-acyl-phospholipid synthase [Candidatus Margulisbacteria bacterium GWE2_39_32]PZM83006.1 MAG: cyclopropane fatty acyl phospholipid synthase [Candidatus Margulisiibacteriota bacterium]HAR62166.1 cyclopropane fatty acyl phospholipid synthase [Candida